LLAGPNASVSHKAPECIATDLLHVNIIFSKYIYLIFYNIIQQNYNSHLLSLTSVTMIKLITLTTTYRQRIMHTTTDATKLAITRHGVNKSSPTNFHKISTRYLAHIFNRAGMLTPRDHSDPVYSRTSLCTVYTKNCLTCKNYTAIYEIFQDHQVNSRRFPGVVETVRDDSKYINVNHHNNKWWQWECRCKSISS